MEKGTERRKETCEKGLRTSSAGVVMSFLCGKDSEQIAGCLGLDLTLREYIGMGLTTMKAMAIDTSF